MRSKMMVLILLIVLVIAFSISPLGCAPGESVPEESENITTDVAVSEGVTPAELKGNYPDGRYRGAFHDSGIQQVGIQFHLEDNTLYDLSFRVLAHGENNFLNPDNEGNSWSTEDLEALKEQHEQLLEYLEGRDISEVQDLYTPEVAADDFEGTGELVDTWTGATVRGSKIISAIRDGLNRGPY